MDLVRSASLLFLSMIALLMFSGCTAPGFDIEKEILHEPAISFEPRIGYFTPNESNFDGGAAGGAKISYEFQRHAYTSLEISYASVEGDDTGFTGTVQPTVLRSIGAEGFSRADRIAIIFGMDWDIPLTDSEYAPLLRVGIGPGILFTRANGNSSLVQGVAAGGGQELRAKDRAFFVIRPNVGIRLPFGEDLSVFGEAQYDWAKGSLHYSVNGDDTSSASIDFGGISFLVGLAYKIR